MNANRADIRFFGSLNNFLKPNGQANFLPVEFKMSPSAKDLIESLGVPHVEIYGIKANEQSVSLDYNVLAGGELEVFPNAFRPDTEKTAKVPFSFIADVHLGKLARLMRLLGFDTTYKRSEEDKQIIGRAVDENRAVLTRDLDLLKHGRLTYGYWLRSVDPDRQTMEVMHYFGLADKAEPFTRCLEYNGGLYRVDYTNVAARVPDRVKEWCSEYMQCKKCQKIYWKGSHYERLEVKVGNILARL